MENFFTEEIYREHSEEMVKGVEGELRELPHRNQGKKGCLGTTQKVKCLGRVDRLLEESLDLPICKS